MRPVLDQRPDAVQGVVLLQPCRQVEREVSFPVLALDWAPHLQQESEDALEGQLVAGDFLGRTHALRGEVLEARDEEGTGIVSGDLHQLDTGPVDEVVFHLALLPVLDAIGHLDPGGEHPGEAEDDVVLRYLAVVGETVLAEPPVEVLLDAGREPVVGHDGKPSNAEEEILDDLEFVGHPRRLVELERALPELQALAVVLLGQGHVPADADVEGGRRVHFT